MRSALHPFIRLLASAALVALPLAASAATPAPHPPVRVDVTKIQPKALLPKRNLHVEITVAINKLGQVTQVRAVKSSGDRVYDSQSYGNALQAFIRLPNGTVVLGTYRLTYDYDVRTHDVRRDVALVSRGGVDPNKEGAANVMLDRQRKRSQSQSQAQASRTPAPAGTINDQRLPDLRGVAKPTPH